MAALTLLEQVNNLFDQSPRYTNAQEPTMADRRAGKATRETGSSYDSEHARRRAQMRDRARDLFMRYGYHKTTIEDIGRASGLGKAALYHYFSGKEEIFAEAVRAEGDRILAKIRAAVDACDDPRAQLVAMVKTSFTEATGIAEELQGDRSAAALVTSLPLAARAHQDFLSEQVVVLRSILDAGARRGVFKKVESPAVPLLIIAGLRSVEFLLFESPNPPSLEEAIDSLLTLFLEGICT
jgi:AcrR family transcriptional regulator